MSAIIMVDLQSDDKVSNLIESVQADYSSKIRLYGAENSVLPIRFVQVIAGYDTSVDVKVAECRRTVMDLIIEDIANEYYRDCFIVVTDNAYLEGAAKAFNATKVNVITAETCEAALAVFQKVIAERDARIAEYKSKKEAEQNQATV